MPKRQRPKEIPDNAISTRDCRRAIKRITPALYKGTRTTDVVVRVLTHFCFDGERAYAYDDVIAISTPLKTPFKGGLVGTVFGSLLDTARGDFVAIDVQDASVKMECAGSIWTLPLMPTDDFLVQAPVVNKDELTVLDGPQVVHLRNAFERCMLSVSPMNVNPVMRGITSRQIKNKQDVVVTAFWSTDGPSISEYFTRNEMPDFFNDMCVPWQFAQVVTGLMTGDDDEGAANFVGFKITEDAIYAVVDETVVMAKRLDTSRDLPFQETMADHRAKIKDSAPIPRLLKDALNNAAIVLESRDGSVCTLRVEGKLLSVQAGTPKEKGSVHEVGMELEGDHGDAEICCAPHLIQRAIPYCTSIGFNSSGGTMSGKNFSVVIAGIGG